MGKDFNQYFKEHGFSVEEKTPEIKDSEFGFESEQVLVKTKEGHYITARLEGATRNNSHLSL